MKIILGFIFFLVNIVSVKAQYDFENYPKIKFKDYQWDFTELEDKFVHKIDVPNFYNNSKPLSVEIKYFAGISRNSEINISGTIYQEDIPFTPIGLDSLRIADVNGDGLNDIKIISYYMGNGFASLNVRVIYFFQEENGKFIKIAYNDKMGTNRFERDFDGDGNFEIITMKIQNHKNHNYWLFNIYDFIEGKLKNVNSKANYPIMIQILDNETFKITNKLSRQEMKKYEVIQPEDDNY
ncbi:hypothetical protein J2X31_001784 [Flavobacterium arsenatis]|uniref:VCBS repeat-containing protein n=1 Tax=Flavobacterium arsenatis TaxID=1484332 RepID=A0ABU1TP82_9FLAO|nr:hypothetical protein [Flavobacterium arsenatis]MDR6967772.1 hypothetical protein [Flavobacterium arsenatis]